MQETLAPGFITVAEALDLINSFTREKPTVDINFLLDNMELIQEKHNLTIRMPRKQIVDSMGNRKWTSDPSVHITIRTLLEQEQVRDAVKKKYQEMTGKTLNVEELGLRRVTTVMDDQKNKDSRPMVNEESEIKLGDTINSGMHSQLNTDN